MAARASLRVVAVAVLAVGIVMPTAAAAATQAPAPAPASHGKTTIPSHYADKYLREETHMYLELLGKKWDVSILYNGASHDKKLRRGWQKFVKDNNLKMGDIRLFELLSNESRCTMEVHISPVNGRKLVIESASV